MSRETGRETGRESGRAAGAEPGAVARPSKIAITQLLAEAEVARRRSLRTLLAAIAVPVLVGAGLLVFTSVAVNNRIETLEAQGKQIEANAQKIKEQEGQIAEQRKRLDALAEQLEGTAAIANAALNRIERPELRKEIADSVASDPSLAGTTPRVYIHIHEEAQRAQAAEVERALEEAEFIVPGIERRPEEVRANQVRYFRPEDRPAAERVASILAARGVRDPRAVQPAGLRAPAGQLEVWFAPGRP